MRMSMSIRIETVEANAWLASWFLGCSSGMDNDEVEQAKLLDSWIRQEYGPQACVVSCDNERMGWYHEFERVNERVRPSRTMLGLVGEYTIYC